MGLFLLDYGAGNVQSLANSLTALGHSFEWIKDAKDFDHATVRFFLSAIFMTHTIRRSSSPA